MLSFHLKTCGGLLLALSLLHLVFPRRFQWSQELARISLLNRQIFYVHTFFLCVVLVMMGLVSLDAEALLEPSRLGVWVAAGLTVFWQLRLLTQHLVYDSSLWRGKPFETAVHWIFTLLWSYLSLVYGGLLWHQLHS